VNFCDDFYRLMTKYDSMSSTGSIERKLYAMFSGKRDFESGLNSLLSGLCSKSCNALGRDLIRRASFSGNTLIG